MRQSRKVLRSRVGLVLGGAVVTLLVLPVAAFAGGFSAPSGVHHQAATGAGASGGLAILIGVIAVAVVSVLILSLAGEKRDVGRRAASIRRKPAGSAS